MGGEMVGDGVGRSAMVLVAGGRWWGIGDGKEGREEERPWKLGATRRDYAATRRSGEARGQNPLLPYPRASPDLR